MLLIRNGRYLLALLFTLFLPNMAQAQDWAFYTQLSSLNSGGSQPLHQLINEMEGSVRPSSSDAAFSHFDIEFGADNADWRVGVFLRHDYYARFNRDTIELAYLDKNDLPVETNRRYDLWFKIHQLRAEGVRVEFPQIEIDPVKFRLGVSLFHATGLRDGLISGRIATTDDDYDGLIFVDYAYDKDILLDRPLSDSPEGWGFGLNFSLDWQINDRLNLNLELKDLAGQIRWDRAPYTAARVTSATVNFDENGFIETTPILSGIESYKKYSQKLPLQSQLRLNYRLSNEYGLFGGNDQFGHEHFPLFGVMIAAPKSMVSVAWQANSQALQLEWRGEKTRLKITADDINMKKIETFGLELEFVTGS